MNGNQQNRQSPLSTAVEDAIKVEVDAANARAAERATLEAEINERTERLSQLREENATAGGKSSNILKDMRRSKAVRVAKRVVGYALVGGVVILAGSYVYSRLRSAGVDVPDGDAIGNAVAGAVDAATA